VLDILLILGVLALVATVPRLVVGHRRRARWRALSRAQRVAIAALSQGGLTRITGTIEPRGALVTSPIALQPCVGYSTVVEVATKWVTWRMVMNSMKCGSFYVKDETGTALVEEPIFVVRGPGTTWETPPESAWQPTGNQRVRCHEVLLQPGDRVSVLGRVTMELDPAGRGSYREAPVLAHLKGSADEPVVVAHLDASVDQQPA
jgi:hypothetical protein